MSTRGPTVGTSYDVRARVAQIMGLPVSVHVRAVDPDRPDIADAVDDVWSLLRDVDEVFSPWRHDSDLMQVRRGLLPESLAHPWMSEVRALCARAADLTGGLFTTDLTGPDGTPGWDQLDVPYVSEADFAGELLGYADAVVVESPDELRAAVHDRLSGVLAGDAR